MFFGLGLPMEEIYNNVFNENDSWLSEGKDSYLRGGQFLIHDNQFKGQNALRAK